MSDWYRGLIREAGGKGVTRRRAAAGAEGCGHAGGRAGVNRYHCKLTINELALIKEPLRS
jgi:hypothetical protein